MASRLLAKLAAFFGSWRFPTLALSTTALFHLFLLSLLVLPASSGTALSAFTAEFRTWCLGWDPATGRYEWGYVAMVLSEPVVLGAVLVGMWWSPLREVLRRSPRAMVPWALGGAAIVVVLAGGLFAVMGGRSTAAGGEAFPAAALRTAVPAPELHLVDHEGKTVTLEELRGRVVVLTGVYAACRATCPMILGQAKRAVAALDPADRAAVTVVAVTMDPEHDDSAKLAHMAEAQGVSAPTFRLSGGEPAKVEALLDRIGVERRRDPETGVIDHTNVFAVIDRAGKLAYRFSLGETQQRWLAEALRTLAREPRPAGAGS